jgi:MSHA type pilus biogenesis protein MshL
VIRFTCDLARVPLAAGALLCAVLVAGCAIPPLEPRAGREGHIGTPTESERAALGAARQAAAIPKPVRRSPVLPKPTQAASVETYTVVVNGVPVRELLFALARDAALNVDIHPDVTGDITLNAIEQSLPQILSRLSNQVDLRYRFHDDLLTVMPDTPFLRTYKVDYVNLRRGTENTVNVSTQISAASSSIGAGGAGDNNSDTKIKSSGEHDIWTSVTRTLEAMVTDPRAAAQAVPGKEGGGEERLQSVFANSETGLVTVRATQRQHAEVQQYLERVLNELQRQVMIEVTVVEVRLNDRYQAGIDWSKIPISAGISLTQSLIGGGGAIAATAASAIPSALAGATRPFFFAQYANRRTNGVPSGDLTVTASFLKEFGDTRVISSPKIMALNNQTAVLKVVDNVVYFEVNVEKTTPIGAAQESVNVETTPKTVPVGFVMAVTPQIDAADLVTLNVRPTITRILRFKNDPNPQLDAATPNQIPELQVRELESVLRVRSGNIAVMGGLMEDTSGKSTDGVPLLSDIPEIGELFNFRDHNFGKTELVVFIRPWVIRNASVVSGDLVRFKRVLPENLEQARPVNSPPREALSQ